MLKQVILVRGDLRLSAGKMSVQVAHASVDCAMKAGRKLIGDWLSTGGKKVVLEVAGEAELRKFMELAIMQKLKCSLVSDAGRTHLEPGTVTCLGIGPDNDDKIDSVTGNLKIL